MGKLPITGWPSNVIRELKSIVRKIAEHPSVKKSYIGKTNDPDRRKTEHDCDDLVVIYETSSPGHAQQAEYDLINAFWMHPKCSNGAPGGGGPAADEYWQYVYVAVWFW
mgnify:CR=1 FL=1